LHTLTVVNTHFDITAVANCKLTIIFSKIVGKKTTEKINSDDLWESIAKNYGFIEGAQMSNSFIILLALSESKQPLSTTQIQKNLQLIQWVSYSKFLVHSRTH
jgi:hypothetical protein